MVPVKKKMELAGKDPAPAQNVKLKTAETDTVLKSRLLLFLTTEMKKKVQQHLSKKRIKTPKVLNNRELLLRVRNV